MRTKLAKLGSDTRFAFRGKFARYGYKRNHDRSGFEHYVPTIMLTTYRFTPMTSGMMSQIIYGLI